MTSCPKGIAPRDMEACVYDAFSGAWQRFGPALDTITSDRADGVLAALDRVERACEKQGLIAVGWISYEAAPGFDGALRVKAEIDGFPACCFGLYGTPSRLNESVDLDDGNIESVARGEAGSDGLWTPECTRAEYADAVARIRERIRRGETYQVNYTLRLRKAAREGWPLFLGMIAAQRPCYGAYLNFGRWSVCSASPELFFKLDGTAIESHPMKGTAARAGYEPDDDARALALFHSEKNRAENVMIVDMVRNDLGRISRAGSVHVPALYGIERYPTVWQMTSRVKAETTASLSDIFRSTFPPASITGAPKPHTMSIISDIERSPRRVYTGAVGFVAPGRRAQFNVAIRTALIDKERGCMEYGAGGGIVWDSEWKDEYAEMLAKAALVTAPTSFSILESLLYTPEDGFFLLPRHIERAERAARHFGFSFDADAMRRALLEVEPTLPTVNHKVRVLISRFGRVRVEATPLAPQPAPTRVRTSAAPISRHNRFLYHKTTERSVYETALRYAAPCDDVILWNEEREVTESAFANVVARFGNKRVTPPVSCGLLAGTFRAELLARGEVEEAIVPLDRLALADELWLINSVHKWRRAQLENTAPIAS